MGLFNKMINYVTGGSAQVDVEIEDAHLSSPFPVTVSAEIFEDSIMADNVYLLFRCTEGKLVGYKEGEAVTDNEKILLELNEWDIDTIFEHEVQVAGEGELVAGQVYNWEVNVDLSKAEHPSSKTEGREIRWEVQAGIAVPGNDPDSGWVTFEVH